MFYAKWLIFICFLSIFPQKCAEKRESFGHLVPIQSKNPADSARAAGRIPEPIQNLIDQFCECADTSYQPNDSSDTRWFELSARPEESFILVENGHYCGYGSGSCGYQILLIHVPESGKPELVLDDCGAFAGQLSTVHNGMYDFKIQYRTFYREDPVWFRWTGKTVVEFADPKPQNDTDAVFNLLQRYYPKEQFFRFDFEFNYVKPGNSDAAFVLVRTISGIFLLRSVNPGKFEILNRFEENDLLSFCETKTNGFYDLETSNWNSFRKNIWKWNGKEYKPEKTAG